MVILLVSVLSVVLSPILLPSAGRTVSQVANQIGMQLREIRRLAQSTEQRQQFWVDTLARRYRTDDTAEWHMLPKEMTVQLTTAESLLRSADSGSIEFYPDGTSSGGRIVLGLEGQTAQIDIEWLTGRVRLSRASQ